MQRRNKLIVKGIYKAINEHGIIEDADKRCCNTPALAVTRPGASAGVFRFAQDFRGGNKFTLADRHGLPRPIDVALRPLPRTVNGTGHTGPSVFCATSI